MHDAPRYTRVAMLLHWVTVLLVGALYGVGWTMTELPKGPARGEMFALHKMLGITVFLLTLLRLAWRLRHRPPPFPVSFAGWQAKAARGAHHLFYALLLLQPVLGYASAYFSGHPTRYLGFVLPSLDARDAGLNEFFSEVHEATAAALLLLVVVHVLGGLRHGLRGTEAVIRRMLPW